MRSAFDGLRSLSASAPVRSAFDGVRSVKGCAPVRLAFDGLRSLSASAPVRSAFDGVKSFLASAPSKFTLELSKFVLTFGVLNTNLFGFNSVSFASSCNSMFIGISVSTLGNTNSTLLGCNATFKGPGFENKLFPGLPTF